MIQFMTQLRISEAAVLLGVSDDTVRRMVDAGRLPAEHDDAGRLVVAGADLAAVAQEVAKPAPVGVVSDESARNRMRGIVTRVLTDTVMAQVEMQCGPFRIVSLMSREAVESLGLEVGAVAVASIKSTNVVVGVSR
jgi:molybdopterin-binding protein